jgi:EpsI family protein
MVYFYLMSQQPGSTDSLLSTLNEQEEWRLVNSQLPDWSPIWSKGDETFEGSFERQGNRVDLFATLFLRQRQGSEAVNVRHRVYDVEKWSRISRSARVIELPDAGKVEVEETLLRMGPRQRLVWLWYQTNGKIVSSPMQAKLNNLIGVVRGQPEVAVFVLSREIIQDQNHAGEILEQFFKSYLSHSGDFSQSLVGSPG